MPHSLESVKVLQDNKPLLFVGILGIVVALSVRYFNSPWRKLPPGPSGLPILGNVLQLKGKQWLIFSEWRKKYGPFDFGNSSLV